LELERRFPARISYRFHDLPRFDLVVEQV
jgi:hypothetical protein